jgi:transposase-like protein
LSETGVAISSAAVRWYMRYGLSYRDVTVAGRWTYLYRAVDQFGQLIDVLVSTRRHADAARAFFARAAVFGPAPVEVTTDRAPVYPRIIDELVPAARHVFERYANNAADHGNCTR